MPSVETDLEKIRVDLRDLQQDLTVLRADLDEMWQCVQNWRGCTLPPSLASPSLSSRQQPHRGPVRVSSMVSSMRLRRF
ncbi:MAG: hypothetical protein HYX76_06175 [Acidobacteria bacterium]|nr:hypothetical protein [Acidobacteriota bacterium]